MWLNIVNQPFPINTWRRYWVRGVGFGLFVFLFLYLFKPFRLDLYTPGQLLYTTAVFGLITGFVIFSGSFLLIKVIAPYINEERWTLGKQILWNTLLMIIIAVLNVLATQLMLGMPIPLSFYFTMLEWVFLLGVLPIAIAELITYNHYLRRHVRSAAEMSQLMEKISRVEKKDKSVNELSLSSVLGTQRDNRITNDLVTSPDILFASPADLMTSPSDSMTSPSDSMASASEIILTGENQRDNLELSADSLLAVQSLDNYVNIFWESQGKLKSTMLRNTLTSIADQLVERTYIYRTHRGWLVNTRRVSQVEGNAQGLKLSVELLPQQIPVSRSNIPGYREVSENENMTILSASR